MLERDYNKIFNEYQGLKSKTHLEAQILKPGEAYRPVRIDGNDLMRKNELRDELKDNLDKLTDEELKELYKDHDLAARAVEVLVGRKINNK